MNEQVALPLSPALTELLFTYNRDDATPPPLCFAEVVRVVGPNGDYKPALHSALRFAATDELLLGLNGHYEFEWSEQGFYVEVHLADGSSVVSHHASHRGFSGSWNADGSGGPVTTIALSYWHLSGPVEPIAWVGTLYGPSLWRRANLIFEDGPYLLSRNSLFLEGNARWVLTRDNFAGEQSCLAVIDSLPADNILDVLASDFSALQFLFGTRSFLGVLVGVNDRNEVVAAYGANLGVRPAPSRSACPPLPNDDNTWNAVAFPLLAKALLGGKSRRLQAPTNGYVESTEGAIDFQILLACVALEGAADHVVKVKPKTLKSRSAWKKWVSCMQAVWEPMLHVAGLGDDEIKERKAGVRARLENAAEPTARMLVQAMFAAWGIKVPEEALDELARRNVVAHTGLIVKDSDEYDVEREVKTLRVVRSLLAAAVLRHVGYTGKLLGYEKHGWSEPLAADWFPVSEDALKQSQIMFSACRIE